jgi:iron complex outermembrane receptor protein
MAQAHAQSIADLQQMSIGQLQDIDVMSVTRTVEPLKTSPAAIYVITHEAIARSGYSTIPDILRLAPNLQVKQITASRYIITARGLSGNLDAQNFANKLLVLIDGRSVYTPLYSGVYWDMQDVVPADIERIEVISGPGATLWGANAVNGVINIITRSSEATQGGLLDISLGNLEQTATLEYGGRLADTLTYRAYIRDVMRDNTGTASGAAATDHWSKPQGGVRVDWAPNEADTVSFSGNLYAGAEAQPGAPDENIRGVNVLARWNHLFADASTFQLNAYYDRASRGTTGNGHFWLDTYNVDAQHSFAWGEWNTLTWGGGLRISDYTIDGTPSLFFAPPRRTLILADAFVQDSIAISPDVTAVLGFKLEDDPYSGVTALPSARLSWKVADDLLFWGAVSRAIRSPTPFDRDVRERLGAIVALDGDSAFAPEKLVAYELGARAQLDDRATISLSLLYNDYDDLRSVELTTGPAFLNLVWANGLKGRTLGFDVWGEYQLTSWWRLAASFNELSEHFNFKPGASGIVGVSQLGDDPEHSAALRSAMNIGDDINFDAELRYVSALPDPAVPSFVEMNASIGWNVRDDVRLSLSGFNLLHARHLEFPAPGANAVPRSYSVGLQWRF